MTNHKKIKDMANVLQGNSDLEMIICVPVLTMSTGPPVQDQSNFVQTTTFFNFYLELYKNKFKNLI